MMSMLEHLLAAGDMFPIPDRNYMTTGGWVILGTFALATRIILARIKQATDLARIAAESAAGHLEDVKHAAETAADEARQAKELSHPTGNGFATAIVTMIQEQHLEVMAAVRQLDRRVTRLEEKDSAA